ncbi:ester cyclase [Streptomyces sp. NPDC102406]|uniref:ester cyclase n=1 Tax=Streptomyces sp. NPDC102406 TaxID=3366171 RepID=UPI0038095D63
MPPLRTGAGAEGWKASIVHLRGVFGDLAIEIEDVVVNGDMVAVRAVNRGKQTGELLGVEGTGLRGRVPGGRLPPGGRRPDRADMASGGLLSGSRARSAWSSPVALDGRTAVVTGAARASGTRTAGGSPRTGRTSSLSTSTIRPTAYGS